MTYLVTCYNTSAQTGEPDQYIDDESEALVLAENMANGLARDHLNYEIRVRDQSSKRVIEEWIVTDGQFPES